MGVLRKYMHLRQLMSMHEIVEVGLARALVTATWNIARTN